MILPMFTEILLFAVLARGSKVNIWSFDIDHGPAPSPEDAPPFSRHAVRDPSKLKYEIAGIVAGYLAFMVLLGLFLLFVARPIRRKTMVLHDAVAVELVKRPKQMLDPSPISPSTSARSWRKWTKNRLVDNNAAHLASSPASRATTSPKGANIETWELHASPGSKTITNGTQRLPLRLDTSGTKVSAAQETTTASPRSPYHAIYPPYNVSTSTSTGAAVYGGLGFSNVTPIQEVEHQGHRSSPVHSDQSRNRRMHRGSRSSLIGRSTSVRSLDISAPVLQPASAISLDYPLSPRYYPEPGPAPALPCTRGDEAIHQPTSLQHSPPLDEEDGFDGEDDEDGQEHNSAYTYTYTSYPQHSSSVYSTYQSYPAPTPPTQYSASTYSEHLAPFDSPRPVPQPAPQRSRVAPSPSSSSSSSSSSSPPPILPYIQQQQQRQQLQPLNSSPTRTSPTPKPLPFRAMTSQHSTSPTTSSPATHHSTTLAAFSATPTRVTFLSPRRDVFANGRPTPGTAGFVPYTPYMPFTPVTPVTPHLAGRAERAARRRRDEQEGRGGAGAVWEEDRVRSEGELWGEAY